MLARRGAGATNSSKYALLGRLAHLPAIFSGSPASSATVDRAVRALVGAHPPEEEQVVAALAAERVEGEVERVRAVGDPRAARGRGLRWFIESEIERASRRDPHDLRRRAGPARRRAGPWTVWATGVGSSAAEREAHQARVVVDHVEVARGARSSGAACWSSQNVRPIRSLGAVRRRRSRASPACASRPRRTASRRARPRRARPRAARRPTRSRRSPSAAPGTRPG